MTRPVPPLSRATVLIVEDDVFTAMCAKDALQDAGYVVMDLTDRNREAMAAARECKPDLALVNIDLRGGDDGIALAGELTALGVPVIFISGQTSRAASARTAAIGSMPKPYAFEDLVLAVDYVLHHLKGDNTRPHPAGLQIFDAEPELL